MIDAIDKKLINVLQAGLPITETPFAAVAADLGLDQGEMIRRIRRLLDQRVLSRFGPMYDAQRLGGGMTLAAIAVPDQRFTEVADMVNAHPEVAHNYRREHRLNMWFVLATEQPQRIPAVIREIERETGLKVVDLPKEKEYFLDLRLKA